MTKNWHKNHISTKWGIGILGILLLGLIIFLTQINQTQNLFSRAAPYNPDTQVYFGKTQYGMTNGKDIDIPIFISTSKEHPFLNMHLTINLPKNIFNILVLLLLIILFLLRIYLLPINPI